MADFTWSASTTAAEWVYPPKAWPPIAKRELWPVGHRNALDAALASAGVTERQMRYLSTWATENEGDPNTWTLHALVKR